MIETGQTMSEDTPAISSAKNIFERIRHVSKDGTEYWLGRELSTALEYAKWDNFLPVISRAKISMERSGIPVDNHFLDIRKMVALGSDAARETDDMQLTRYACYVIAQNGNPAKKPRIAEAQAYFALQTRKQELYEQYNEDMKRLALRQEFSAADKALSQTVMEAGIAKRGLGQIKSDGDKEFFGGNTSRDMKAKYGITNNAPWANRAPNVVLAGKTLANEMTATNIERRGVSTFPAILEENNDNNRRVREALIDGGITPEEQPAAEDTEQVRRRVNNIDKIKPKPELES